MLAKKGLKSISFLKKYYDVMSLLVFFHTFVIEMEVKSLTLSYSLNKKEWICSLFKEWIWEKSEIRVNLEWIWSEHLCYSLILEWPQGSLGIPEVTHLFPSSFHTLMSICTCIRFYLWQFFILIRARFYHIHLTFSYMFIYSRLLLFRSSS